MRDPLEKAEVAAARLAQTIGQTMPEGFGFTVILYSYGEHGVMTYLSSGERGDCIKMLRELADKIEKNEKGI